VVVTDISSMVSSFDCCRSILGALYGLLFARKPGLDRARARQIMGWALVFGALFVLTLKSRRMVEYLVPVTILWVSSLWTLLDRLAWVNSQTIAEHTQAGGNAGLSHAI
jgi:hypothetical protein